MENRSISVGGLRVQACYRISLCSYVGEGSTKHGCTLDWVLSDSGRIFTIQCINGSCLEHGQFGVQLKF